MKPITYFIDNTLYPALFEWVDQVFPAYGFRRVSIGWVSSLKIDLSQPKIPRKDKSYILKDSPKYLNEWGEKPKDLLTLWKEQTHIKNTFEAVEALCKQIGINPPERQSSEEWDKFQKETAERENLLHRMRLALDCTKDGGKVIDYLCKRGYKGEYIDKLRDWGIGCITPKIMEEMGDTLPYRMKYGNHLLAIPYRSNGRILGFVFRDITDTDEYKYQNTKRLPKNANFFGLTGLKFTGDKEKDRTLYIVEGQLDALHAQLEGMENVVASGGTTLNEEALKMVKAKGVEKVVIIFDSEGDPQKDKQRDKDRYKALQTIHSLGMEGFSVTLPTQEGNKTDIDSYLNNHTLEDLEREIEVNMKEAGIFFYEHIRDNALTKFKDQKQGEIWNPLLISEFLRDLLNLLRDPNINQVYKEKILENAEYDTGMDRNALRKEAEKLKAADDIARHQEETKRVIEQASLLAKAGKTEETLDFLKAEISRLSLIKRETKFEKMLKRFSPSEFEQRMKNQKLGITTPYILKKDKEEEIFMLPSGAITLIVAPTSHGKSTLSQNLALQIATNGEEGSVLYFTFEEEEDAVKIQFLNKFLNITITRGEGNNLRTLKAYYSTGSYPQYFRGDAIEPFEKGKKEFYSLLENGKLEIFRENWDAIELKDAITYYCKHRKVKAIFIDYLQLLKINGFKGDRRLELSEISKMFNNLAIDLSLPIILAAQLNREAGSPLDMHAQNLAESADIERYANTILTLWNSSFKPTNKQSAKDKDLQNFEKNIMALGSGGEIYVKIIKNRGGLVGVEGVLDYNGNTGVISPKNAEDKSKDNPQTKADTMPKIFK